ncbi:MAG: nucleotidyltransferase domain-containing protein [Phycisphaerae bacterium]|nr:nucleotidyltransferase domain-containing protein [Saprospiraceae bacterium]
MTEVLPSAAECPTKSAVIQALAYFEVFSYPLTPEEIFAFCAEPRSTREEVFDRLQSLVEQGSAFQFGGFFQLKKEASWGGNRRDCNCRADKFLPIARRVARFIGCFPFVRGVFVSGSLSKHCMRPDSDIDFFVVTAPGRLWLARTLLVLFKKIFLLNSHKYFCVNYFVDTEHLEIEEKNRFTATESVTLLPMWGREIYLDFCRANVWAWQRYPHFAQRPTVGIPAYSRGFFKKLLEKMLTGKLGDWLDRKAMRLTVSFWKRKFQAMDSETFDLALKSRRGVSKHHPLHFQQKVLERFEENLRRLGH